MLLFIYGAAIMHGTISLEFYIYNFCFPYLLMYWLYQVLEMDLTDCYG